MSVEWDRDGEHLKVLGIVHYVKGGLWTLGCLGGGMYLAMAGFMGTVMRAAPQQQNPPPEELIEVMTGMMVVIGGGLLVFCGAMAVLTAYAGWCLQKAQRRVFCLVVAAFNLLNVPVGTVLGVFTIIVLSRDSVVERFERGGAPPAESPPAAPVA